MQLMNMGGWRKEQQAYEVKDILNLLHSHSHNLLLKQAA